MNELAKPRIAVTKDGPYIVTGSVPLLRLGAGPEEGVARWQVEESLPPRMSYALCRCGRSTMQPFCDYKHLRGKFVGSETADRNTVAETDGSPDAPVSVGFLRPADGARGGPLWVRGEIDVVSADGFRYATGRVAALCRCGASRTKPFCDGSHAAATDPA